MKIKVFINYFSLYSKFLLKVLNKCKRVFYFQYLTYTSYKRAEPHLKLGLQ